MTALKSETLQSKWGANGGAIFQLQARTLSGLEAKVRRADIIITITYFTLHPITQIRIIPLLPHHWGGVYATRVWQYARQHAIQSRPMNFEENGASPSSMIRSYLSHLKLTPVNSIPSGTRLSNSKMTLTPHLQFEVAVPLDVDLSVDQYTTILWLSSLIPDLSRSWLYLFKWSILKSILDSQPC